MRARASRRGLLTMAVALSGGLLIRRLRRGSPAWGDQFAHVERVEPEEALAFLAGRHPAYPRAGIDSLTGFSAANIVETMDTELLDEIEADAGPAALAKLYRLIALHLLEALRWVYVPLPVVLALDAGHGGHPDVYYDPGANGTEAVHTRQVVSALEALAGAPHYAGIVVRRIFNDAIGDDFGMPSWYDCDGGASLTMRNVRAAMLAEQVAAWNRAYPSQPVAVHVLSVHFNAGSGGILVLHQGDLVPTDMRKRSIAFAEAYLASVRPALAATGLLPYPLRPLFGTGLADDTLLYEPHFCFAVNPYTGVDQRELPARYALLQASEMQRDFVAGVLRYRGLD